MLGPLKRHFGHDQFRPLQREIVQDALAGQDVFVLMPTGGGKSLCFQLPALMREGLTIVVSPLIALMKDQVDALQTSGIPATYLNSTLDREEAKARWRGLHRGEYRMLYVAPERLMLDAFLERALNWDIAQFAIDEAHCISEWGHDFRPEYRELKKLRKHLPDVPIMALTATATERVRADIIKELKLRDPRAYVASFNRPNLTYRVVPKTAAYEQLLAFIRSRPNDSGIVYCASRKSTESLARNLNEDGITAKPYHAGLTNAERTKHQDAFLRDDVRVITATIAFGMGINKPNVRFVVHYDLPRNIESYYQETGRAGRDGLPSECVLLFSPGDVAKQLHFIDEKAKTRRVSPVHNFNRWSITPRRANAGAACCCNILEKRFCRSRVTVATIVCSRAKHSTERCTRKNFFPASIASTPGTDSDLGWVTLSMCSAAQTRKRSGNEVTTSCPLTASAAN